MVKRIINDMKDVEFKLHNTIYIFSGRSENMMKIKQIINREIILYLLFGGMTTIVNFGSFALFDFWMNGKYYLLSNIVSFVFATIFAFVTNKQWVFGSKCWKASIVMHELASFTFARIFTFLFIEELGLLIAVEILEVEYVNIWLLNGKLLAKIMLAFIAVLFNYVVSKFFIFHSRKKKNSMI